MTSGLSDCSGFDPCVLGEAATCFFNVEIGGLGLDIQRQMGEKIGEFADLASIATGNDHDSRC
jgi:hypothetical protein